MLAIIGKRIGSEDNWKQNRTEFVEDNLECVEIDGIKIGITLLKRIAKARQDGRVVILQEHRIADGAEAWTVSGGKIVRGEVHHHINPYRMYFHTKDMGFPFNNESIGIEVFASEVEARNEIKKWSENKNE